ncbi:hypothetical protein [Haliovirga abyssi]|uniref:Peptidase S74 domain-containing protein n=1 Tax=Haliovirga abyssi TaxID=2996794 RepID=A0AAU9E578_9FUSO|nr:hypothetical protein [Haliovirga abyssi]BDU51690.1 hypothetical protein HLVA_22590 [Haliovirga abyssi]
MKKIIMYIIILLNFANIIMANETVPYNLINNGFMNELNSDGKTPKGYSTTGMTIEAVHPYTKAFEGPYVATSPANATKDVESATKTTPYWFRRYYKGPRISRGGLGDGWNGRGDGHILKVTGNVSKDARGYQIVRLPYVGPVVNGGKIHFSVWIKIVKGDYVCFGTDAGYDNGSGSIRRGTTIYKTTTDKGAQGWYKWEFNTTISETTRLGGNQCSLGFEAVGNDGPIEIYLALPYARLINNGKSWMPSAEDIVNNRLKGNVGIGTSNPRAKLDIQGKVLINTDKVNVDIFNVKGENGGQYFRVLNGDSGIGITDKDWTNTLILSNKKTYNEIYSNAGKPISIQSQKGGNVLIGTTSNKNNYKLAVEGTIGAREIVVTQDKWYDNVFEKSYKLKPLEEVSNYVKENKHLPDIPSEKEVKSKGVSVGDMQAKLLQKVEELTLYVIELKKENEDLRKNQNKMKEKINKLEKK